MKTFLQSHPFAVEAYFDSSLVLTFAAPKEEIQPFLPACFILDTFENTWAFLAVALVQTRDLRPKGFPIFFGNDFFLIGYRLFVRYTNNAGKNLRGLYILKSETDKKRMKILGNIFTKYSYTTTDISVNEQDDRYEVRSSEADLHIVVDKHDPARALPISSPFSDWKEARRFAGPLPFTFSIDATKNEVLIVEGVREDWIPKPVKVIQQHVGYIDSLGLQGLRLANAFIIHHIPYHWKKGKTELWKP